MRRYLGVFVARSRGTFRVYESRQAAALGRSLDFSSNETFRLPILRQVFHVFPGVAVRLQSRGGFK
jgi:hypothetical protein